MHVVERFRRQDFATIEDPNVFSGPGVLLLHQCNQQRKLWDVLGERMASSGINVLTFDYRGFGESGGARYDKLGPKEQDKITSETWPGDIDIAFRYLLAQPGVDRRRIGAGGASCGVDNSVKLARRHPEIRALVLLAGETDRAGRQLVETSKGLPIFTSAADDDVYGPQVLEMQWLFSLSRNPSSRFAHYATGRPRSGNVRCTQGTAGDYRALVCGEPYEPAVTSPGNEWLSIGTPGGARVGTGRPTRGEVHPKWHSAVCPRPFYRSREVPKRKLKQLASPHP
jgi:dienelactone hydrolase